MKWSSYIPIVTLLFSSLAAYPQQQNLGDGGYTFDVASIRLNNSQPGKWSIVQPPEPGRFDALAIPLVSLLVYVYGPQKIRENEIENLPDWGYSDQWNISARTDDDTLARENVSAPSTDVKETVRRNRIRLESLLTTRFSMRARFVTETRTVLVLTTDSRLKLQANNKGNPSATMTFGSVKGSSQNMDSLASILSNALDEPVVNETHLDGTYDYTLTWQPETDTRVPLQGDSIYSAIKDQLGLQLKSEKRPVQILKIEQIERPSPN